MKKEFNVKCNWVEEKEMETLFIFGIHIGEIIYNEDEKIYFGRLNLEILGLENEYSEYENKNKNIVKEEMEKYLKSL